MRKPRPEIDLSDRECQILACGAMFDLATRRKASPEDLFDFARDRADLSHPIDRAQDPSVTIIGQDGRCLTMVDFEPRLDCLRPVVRAAGEFASTAAVANPVDFWPMVSFVIA